jgi:hypothetical protein
MYSPGATEENHDIRVEKIAVLTETRKDTFRIKVRSGTACAKLLRAWLLKFHPVTILEVWSKTFSP